MPAHPITIRSRYLPHLGKDNPRLREWWYVKNRKQPPGKIGRPRSPVPRAERLKAAREKRKAILAQRGLVVCKAALPSALATRLLEQASAQGRNFAEYLGDLIVAASALPN